MITRLKHGLVSLSLPVKVLYTKTFRSQFFDSVRRVPLRMLLISPFITQIPGYARSVEFVRFIKARGDTEITIVTRPPGSERETLSPEEAELLVSLGVDLRIRNKPKLHSKIYYFSFQEGDYAAFVGSANFTIGGFERNDESIAFFRDSRHRKFVDTEVNRLTMIGAYPYNHWKIMCARDNQRR